MKDKSFEYKMCFYAGLGLIITIILLSLCSCSPGKHIETWVCKKKVPVENGYFYRFESLSGDYGRERFKDSTFCDETDTLRWKIIKGMDYIQK